jgi:CheY-like chemotaxis protein
MRQHDDARTVRILVVDDDDDVREVVAMLLEAYGFCVVTAVDGEDALQRISDTDRPSLVLLDLRMPVLDGRQLVDVLRAREPASEVPIVVMSGDRDARRTAAAIGAAGCLTKPMDVDDLLDVVTKLAS